MGCSKTLAISPAVAGAHLSFYWTMDEAGVADKLDSTVGLAWPLEHGAAAGVGLFSNGTHCDPTLFINQHRGLGLFGTGSITINQATSKGITVWYWVKILSFGPAGGITYFMDTSDIAHTNQFKIILGSTDGTHTDIELQHNNDTDTNLIDTPDLSWSIGSWHLVVGTYDKTAHTMNLYIDGVLSVTGPDPSVYPDLTNTDMELANTTQPGGTQDFIVDECGISLSGAASAAQVTALWNGGVGVTWPNITPIFPYP